MKHSWKLGVASLAIATAGAWSAGAAHADAHRGGTLRLLAVAAQGTIDPQMNYAQQYWEIFSGMYDGLVTFKKVGGDDGNTIVPDIAEAIPEAQDGGKTYVFKIRKGIKFSNGKELGVADVVASFQRIFKISGPTAGTFYNVIVGADACLKTPASCTLDGGVVGDAANGTVTIHLTQPDSEFFDKLALPHAAIVPAETEAKDQGNNPIPSTGAYMTVSYDPNKQWKIVRNPSFKEWSKDAQPDGYPDGIDYDFGLTDEAEITAIANGQADWTSDTPPTDRLSELGTKYAKQTHVTPLGAIRYAAMNTNEAPFNDPRVRQAVNYAINRNAVVKLFGGKNLAQPSCQILPPGFPGYVEYCPYTKNPDKKWSAADIAKAKALVKESGTAGQAVTIIAEDTAISRALGGYMQSVLTDLGYKTSLKALSTDVQWQYISNSNNKMQMGITTWYQDYPAPSDFLYVLLSCSSFHPGSDASPNVSGFCDKEMEAKMQEAMTASVTDPAKAATLWAAVDHMAVDKAPWAVLVNPKHVDFVSKRVGGFQFNPQYYWLPQLSWVQ
ncbi:MAG TPA: ABC transporter substrate-binding protein [Dongiaceae bacterium]|jgi:peptide/nickel transport system substrate-binding protein|nr:ABC transporter substrate-binding protein [Dongiaceae bacterium]